MNEILTNGLGEKVEVTENPDGTATAVLEGTATRNFKDFDTALEMLYSAGFRE